MADVEDLAEQELEATEAGIAEVLRLLQQPADLTRLGDITTEFEARHRAAKTSLSAMVQSQVDATRSGMELLERSRRHMARLGSALDKIDSLCAECGDLVAHADRIKLLATAHSNLGKVLTEIEDIVDLPYRADKCWDMLEAEEAALVPAFEALVLLTGTAENAKQAWQRNNKSAAEVSELATYLHRVDEVQAAFEERLFGEYLAIPGLVGLARERPSLLVDCNRVLELQERLDEQWRRVKMGTVPQRRYKDRFLSGIAQGAEERFAGLLDMARACGEPNKTVKYDQHGDLVVSEARDYLGALTRLTRIVDRQEETVVDPEELRGIEVIEEAVFDEAAYLDELLEGLYQATDELAAAYDYAAPCFPPQYDFFSRLFAAYHVQAASVVDCLGHGAAEGMSTAGALRVMDWVTKYTDTLRNLGVDEDLLRLPRSPHADPDSMPGMVVLMESYVERMETTMRAWYTNILDADLQAAPKVGPTGQLCTLGAVDFFRILAQQTAIIEALNDHGEVLFQTATTALRLMSGFQAAQTELLGGPGLLAEAGQHEGREDGPAFPPGRPLSLEMAVALANNNVSCYEQSLEFAEDVQKQLSPDYRERLDVEDACRGFLEVARVATFRAMDIMYNDPGMAACLRAMYATGNAEYLAGRTTATLIATLRDYFSDLRTWVAAPWLKRVGEAALQELVRRLAALMAAAPPQSSASLLARMEADEAALAAHFEPHLKPARLKRHMDVLADMRELLGADSPETFSLAYTSLLAAQPRAFTLEAVTRLLANCRPDLSRKQVSEMTATAKELWKQRTAVAKAGPGSKAAEEGWGFFGWGRKKQQQ